ncbi:MAG: hypothetical protein JO223_11985 [Hyphomicrobiales bacterium]|nr:hypothetical protein [Hyphomicrobiales bacterium]MBV8439008.1 hypothetical protein [Hyphomicrobiales bacterium]
MDGQCCAGGVRFRLYPKPPYVHPEWPPETISVSSPPGSIGPGPADARMRLILPVDKRYSYGVNPGPLGTPRLDLPPYRGRIRHPVCPDEEGHFDSIPEGTPEFAEAHVFGTVRFVLDIWERYFGRPIEWHFARDYRQLEIVILPRIDNAYAGYGFMEIGAHPQEDGTLAPYAVNFDVMAHELGHLIIYSTIGVPSPSARRAEYYGFQESAADTTAIIAVLHFESLIERLLEETHGNLYVFNELNRFGELSDHEQVRLASNDVKLSRFSAGWDDEHKLSQPLTGAIFDIGVDIFQEFLVERGVIPRDVAEATRKVRHAPELAQIVQPVFDAAYEGRYQEFRSALIDARDYVGAALAETWKRLRADDFSYLDVGLVLLEMDRAMSGGRYRRAIAESFDWREIGRVTVGPRLKPPGRHSHTHSPRTITPDIGERLPRMTYRERAIAAGIGR